MIHARPDYNRFQDPEHKIPKDEPVFLLRAQDPLFPGILRTYADELEARGGDEEMVRVIREHAGLGARWGYKKKVADMPPIVDVVTSGRADFAAHGSFKVMDDRPRSVESLKAAIQQQLTDDNHTATEVTIFDRRNTRREEGKESGGSWIAKFIHEPEQHPEYQRAVGRTIRKEEHNIHVVTDKASKVMALPFGVWQVCDRDGVGDNFSRVFHAVNEHLAEKGFTCPEGHKLVIAPNNDRSGTWEVAHDTNQPQVEEDITPTNTLEGHGPKA